MIGTAPPNSTSSNPGIGGDNESSVRLKFGKGHIRFEKLPVSVERAAPTKDIATTSAKAILYPLPLSPETAESVAREVEVDFDQALHTLERENSSTNLPTIHPVLEGRHRGKADPDATPSADSGESHLNLVHISRRDG